MASKSVQKIERRPSLHVVEPEIEALRGFQSQSNEVLDTKAGIVLGFSGAILAVLVTTQIPEQSLVPLLGYGLLALAVVFGGAAMYAKPFRYDPSPNILLNEYMDREPDAPGSGVREQILADKVKAYSENERLLGRKACLVNIAVACLAIGVILVSGHNLWRRVMSKETPTPSQTVPAPKPVPPPVAQPNPAAVNTIQKGMGPRPVQK